MGWYRLARALVLAMLLGQGVSATATAAAASLPLEVGSRWELAAAGAARPMRLEVTGRDRDAYVVRWDNPYVNSVFRFRLAGSKVMLAALDMGTGIARMPADTVYFDLDAPEGRSWRNALGTVTVTGRGRRIGAHGDGIEFELVDPKGAHTWWTLSPSVGFLAFGRGPGAFVLASADKTPIASTAPGKPPAPKAGVAPATSPAEVSKPLYSQKVLIGIDANPTVAEGYSDSAKRNRARIAHDAGMGFLYIHPKWTEVEPTAGSTSFGDVDFMTSIADQYALPVLFNLRMIDTNQRAIPSAYASWRFNDDRMVQKLQDILRALAPRLHGRVKWVTIGNEADVYFGTHSGEIADYVALMGRILPTVRELFPGAAFTINFTNGVLSAGNTYAGMLALVDAISYTYYPMNADFGFQNPDNAGADIDALVAAAGSKLVLFQEIGYASSAAVGSGDAQQARFLANAFAALRRNRSRVVAANFVWMSDLPQSVVDDLGKYYSMANGDRFKAFIGSLGYWRTDGTAKPAWDTFRTEAPNM